MSQNFTQSIGKIQSEKSLNHIRPHIKIFWLKIHWNPVFIEAYRTWLIMLGLFIWYGIAYKNRPVYNGKMTPLIKKGSHLFLRKRVCYNLSSSFNKSEDRFLVRPSLIQWWMNLLYILMFKVPLIRKGSALNESGLTNEKWLQLNERVLLLLPKPQFKKGTSSMSQVWLIARGPHSMKQPFLVRTWHYVMLHVKDGVQSWHTQQLKGIHSWLIAKNTMMMCKYPPWWWVSTPQFCTKNHCSHIAPFSFLSLYSSQVDIMLSFDFHSISDLLGGQRYIWLLILYFYVVSFPTEKTRIQPKPLLSLPLFGAIVLRSKAVHIWLIAALEQALLSRKVIWLTFLYFIFWLELI